MIRFELIATFKDNALVYHFKKLFFRISRVDRLRVSYINSWYDAS